MSRGRHKGADQTRAVGYVRVSTEDQNLGPDAQRAAMERWCQAHRVTLVAIHEDRGVSGGASLDKRLGLIQALDALGQHGAGVLLVAKRDRLARDVVVAAMVERLAERRGAVVQSADGVGNGDGPEAMLMRGMMDLFAQYERAIIRARTRAAFAVKKGRGERVGGRGKEPYGFRTAADGRHLERDELEQGVASRIQALRCGGTSIRGIADVRNQDGTKARGARWHPTTVANILERQAAA